MRTSAEHTLGTSAMHKIKDGGRDERWATKNVRTTRILTYRKRLRMRVWWVDVRRDCFASLAMTMLGTIGTTQEGEAGGRPVKVLQ